MWNKMIKTTNRIVEDTTIVIMATMVVIIFMQIVSRAAFNSSFSWTEEIARFLMIWLVFLGSSYAFQYGSHLSIEFIVSKLQHRTKRLFNTLSTIGSSMFFLVVIVKGSQMIFNNMSKLSPALGIPMGYVYIVIPLSGMLILLNMIDVNIKMFTKPSVKEGD